MTSGIRFFFIFVVLMLAAGLTWVIVGRLQETQESVRRNSKALVVPVEVAEVERGPIELRRTFSGALEATAEFVVAPKVSGRIEQLIVDLADTVERGQVVAQLDNAEYIQTVAQAEAELAVARANRAEAGNVLEIAERKLKRIRTLKQRGVASEAQLDTAKAEELAARAKLEVAAAQVTKAEASLEAARIRLGYTTVSADWSGGDDQRLVAERFVDEGGTVSANTPLMSIVELDPITGVIFVTERDYALIEPGQRATLTTDAYPQDEFAGRVVRIAPVFKEATRQARVEILIENPRRLLKPGMFIRVTLLLDQVQEAVIVPRTALTRRDGQTGVFLVDAHTRTAAWQEVKTGIQQEDRVQVIGTDLTGLVVTLGQQMLDDGTAVRVPGKELGPRALSAEGKKE